MENFATLLWLSVILITPTTTILYYKYARNTKTQRLLIGLFIGFVITFIFIATITLIAWRNTLGN